MNAGTTDYYRPDHLRIYKNLYRAEWIVATFELSSESAFEYCVRRQHFVLVIPYTDDGHILVERVFSGNDLKWAILGSGLRPTDNEDFLAAAHRICRMYGEGISLGEITPVAFLENNFRFNAKHCIHQGVALVGRIRKTKQAQDLISELDDRGYMAPISVSANQFESEHNAKVLPLARALIERRLKQRPPDFESEIDSTVGIANRFNQHSRVVKPILRAASRYFGETPEATYKAAIQSEIRRGGAKSVIDVACGDSVFCKQLSQDRQFDFVVANDVAYNQIDLAQKAAETHGSSLVWTNHDARALPFKDGSFDVAIAQNVLHHLPNRDSVLELLTECKRVARRLIVVEIDDPKKSYISAKLVNSYFVRYLRDDYVEFFGRYDFQAFFEKIGLSATLNQYRVFKGAYNVAVVDGD